MKKYVLLAGVNGAGKSTLFSLIPSLSEIQKINLDIGYCMVFTQNSFYLNLLLLKERNDDIIQAVIHERKVSQLVSGM
jgi:predicted ABC-type ATPase